MVLEIFCLLILLTPIIWEVYNDRNGDIHNGKNHDWITRGILMVVGSFCVGLINPDRNFIQALVLSFFSFTLLFPYIINIVLYQRGVIKDHRFWDHLSETAIPDKWEGWRGLHWSIRLLMMLILFSGAVKLYLCWNQFITGEPC